jgi:hypothetical protein
VVVRSAGENGKPATLWVTAHPVDMVRRAGPTDFPRPAPLPSDSESLKPACDDGKPAIPARVRHHLRASRKLHAGLCGTSA